MKDIQHIEVSNRYAKYKFDLFRNITIIRGESGTGKTTLYNMIADYTRDKEKSGVNLSSTAPCVALTDSDWKNQLGNIDDSIVFIDEDSKYISSDEFANAVKNSSNYYVIFNRENLHNLPYSINEIYKIKTSGKHHSLVRVYNLSEKCELRSGKASPRFLPDVVLTEDSHSDYQFFDAVVAKSMVKCVSSGSNSAVFSWLKSNADTNAIVICDGAAFGAEIDRVTKLINGTRCVRLLLPESFEWMILKSGIIKNVDSVLASPSNYIDSAEYFSWENFFTSYLIEKTKDSYLRYSKAKLNHAYLHDSEAKAILDVLPDYIKPE